MSSEFVVDPSQHLTQHVIHVRRCSTNTHVEYIISDDLDAHIVTWRFLRRQGLHPERAIIADFFESYLEIGSCLCWTPNNARLKYTAP